MQIISKIIELDELKDMAKNMFGDLVKAVVDIEKEILAIDAELHSDLEALLIENGSRQKNLWGINFYPDITGDNFIEFDSMINMRPSQENMSRGIDSEEIQKATMDIVNKWITR